MDHKAYAKHLVESLDRIRENCSANLGDVRFMRKQIARALAYPSPAYGESLDDRSTPAGRKVWILRRLGKIADALKSSPGGEEREGWIARERYEKARLRKLESEMPQTSAERSALEAWKGHEDARLALYRRPPQLGKTIRARLRSDGMSESALLDLDAVVLWYKLETIPRPRPGSKARDREKKALANALEAFTDAVQRIPAGYWNEIADDALAGGKMTFIGGGHFFSRDVRPWLAALRKHAESKGKAGRRGDDHLKVLDAAVQLIVQRDTDRRDTITRTINAVRAEVGRPIQARQTRALVARR